MFIYSSCRLRPGLASIDASLSIRRSCPSFWIFGRPFLLLDLGGGRARAQVGVGRVSRESGVYSG